MIFFRVHQAFIFRVPWPNKIPGIVLRLVTH